MPAAFLSGHVWELRESQKTKHRTVFSKQQWYVCLRVSPVQELPKY